MVDYVDMFVDRAKQHQGFLKMLARDTEKQIMVIEAPAEMGKTWLIQRERYECRARNVPVAHFDFRDRLPWDYLMIVRQVRDQLGAHYFNPLTQIINETTAISISVSNHGSRGDVNIHLAKDGAQVEGSALTVGDVAGGNIIKDNFFYVQADSEAARRAIESRISDAFFACLGAIIQQQPVVLLFDTYEEATAEADRWLRAYFFPRLRDLLLPNLIVLVAGRKTPSLDQTWQPVIARTGLAPFEHEDIRQYVLDKRGLKDLDLATIIRTSGGHPGLLAKMADIATIEQSDEREWL